MNTGTQKKNETTSLSFVDLESPELKADEPKNNPEKERLILFLEKTYSSGISDEMERKVEDLFIELAAMKATRMGAMLVLSNYYENVPRSGYTRTQFHVYISKSKAGSQYLDSLNGSATVSDEGGYRSNSFFIRQEDMI